MRPWRDGSRDRPGRTVRTLGRMGFREMERSVASRGCTRVLATGSQAFIDVVAPGGRRRSVRTQELQRDVPARRLGSPALPLQEYGYSNLQDGPGRRRRRPNRRERHRRRPRGRSIKRHYDGGAGLGRRECVPGRFLPACFLAVGRPWVSSSPAQMRAR